MENEVENKIEVSAMSTPYYLFDILGGNIKQKKGNYNVIKKK